MLLIKRFSPKVRVKYNSVSGFVHLFLIVVIVLVGLGGLLYYSWQKGLIKTTPVGVVSPTPNISTNEIVNWKTYRNDKYGFEIKYPESLTIKEASNRIDIIDEESPLFFNMSIETLADDKEKIVDDLVALNSNKPGTSVERESKTKIGKLQTLQIKHAAENKTAVDLFGFYNSNYVVASFLYEDEKSFQTITQILSTFRFLD